jgi:hypothetical protein
MRRATVLSLPLQLVFPVGAPLLWALARLANFRVGLKLGGDEEGKSLIPLTSSFAQSSSVISTSAPESSLTRNLTRRSQRRLYSHR